MRAGTTKGNCKWNDKFDISIDGSVDDSLKPSKRLSQIMSISCRISIGDNDFQQAASDISSVLTMAKHRTSMPLLISVLVSASQIGIAFDDTQFLLNKCPINNEAISSLEPDSEFSLKPAFSDSMIIEKAMFFSAFSDPKFSSLGLFDSLPSIYIIAFGPEDFLGYLDTMDAFSELAMQPYISSSKQIETIEYKDQHVKGIMCAIAMPAMQKAMRLITIAESMRHTMVLATAIHRYSIDEGKLPDDISQLAPKYLDTLTIDPFSGESYKLVHDGNSLTVYGLGPDMIDDGGAVYDAETKTGDIALKMHFE